MTHGTRFIGFAGVAGSLLAAPATAQIKAIAVSAPTQLTAKQVAGGVELDWIAPTFPGATYRILRSDPANPTLAVVSAAPVTTTTYTDQLGTLVLSQPKTFTYAIQAVWTNGAVATSSSVSITLATPRVGTALPSQCLKTADLQGSIRYHADSIWFGGYPSNGGGKIPSGLGTMWLVVSTPAPGYTQPATETILNSSNVSLLANGSALLQPQSNGWFVAYLPYQALGLSFDVTVSTQDAQCTTHSWTTHYTFSAAIPGP